MIVLDTSAVVAVLAHEAERMPFARTMAAASACRMSALNAFETRIVLLRQFTSGMTADFEDMLRQLAIAIDPFDSAQAELAFAAYRRFGRGSGHPARLNFGDCAAYALATSLGLPLLYKGGDFARTDVVAAL